MGKKAFGEQNPTQGEDAVSWQTWSDGDGGTPTIEGDADWGKLKLDLSGEEGRSAVYDLGSAASRTYTLTEHRYGTGDDEPVLQIRGSETTFAKDDLTPLWETYAAPIERTWRYVQIRQSTLIETYILNTFGGDIVSYLPLKEASGTTLADVSGNGRNGAVGGATGPTLGVAGIGDSKTAVSLPGSAAFINWYSAGLNGAFDGAEGALIVWAKVSAAGVWADGVTRYAAMLSADGSNIIRIARSSSNNNAILFQHLAGGTSRFTYVVSNAYTGWLMLGLSWSAAGGYVRAYINGGLFGGNLGAPGSWSGDLASTLCTIGAGDTSSTGVWSGSLAHALLLNRPASDAEMLALFRAAASPVAMTIIGDSISATALNVLKWPQIVRDGYNSGKCAQTNYAVSGQRIIDHLDAQVVSAADDNADVIIIEMGTNDVTTTGLQAEIEENLIELKSDHPNAAIYFMNILPRWTDETGETEVDKSAFRTAIAAACTAQSVTCWDTYTDSWITAADTADGLHPNASGHAKIAAAVLARLP
jgi:lysophospholipase L1-like esterase